MVQLRGIIDYLNPLSRFGKKQYSILFPLITTSLSAVVLEFYVYEILKNPQLVRVPAVVIFLGLIIYFSSHDGLRGGLTATIITYLYYAYLLTTRYDMREAFIYNFETVLALGLLYLALTVVIGTLKQKTDRLLEITEKEKIRLQTIIEHIPAGVISLDKNGIVTHTNKQLEVISGYKIPIGTVLGKDKILVPETYHIKPSQSPLTQVLKEGKTLTKREYTIRRKDGKDRYIQISASPIWGNDNTITAATAIISDITLQKEHERRRDDFVNIASHELRTPITSMKLYVSTLGNRIRQYKNSEVNQIITSIKYQTDRLQDLVEDLLDVSRIQTGKMTFRKEVFSLGELLKETLNSLQAVTKNHKIIYENKLPSMVFGDRFRINQVIINLIINASKYSPIDTDIIVTAKKNKNYVVVSFRDFGIGIEKEQQQKIFNRLYQISDIKAKTFPGLGIGLYISKQIITRHKGRIWVTSEKGKGSTFYFSLPIFNG